MLVTDGMVKRAQVTLLQAQPLTPGKYVIAVGGGEEEVAQALRAGVELAGDTIIDRLYLPKADPQLAPATAGELPRPGPSGALGIVETFSVAAAVLSADRAVKTAEVRLLLLRLARGLGGKAFYVLTGELHQVEAAVEAGRSIVYDGMLLTTEIIARPHPDLLRTIIAQIRKPG
jgi:microcompartment protein CcmL/EutN